MNSGYPAEVAAAGQGLDELQAILSERQPAYYEHQVAA